MKALRVIKYFLVLLVILISTSFAFWYFQKKTSLSIFVIDKTVPDKTYNHHKSFYWILNHNRIVDKAGKPLSYKRDYFGFVPKILANGEKDYSVKSLRLSEILSLVDEIDMVYITDCYGISSMDWTSKSPKVKVTQMYEGLNQNDFLLLSEMRRKNKLIITEFNLLSPPTGDLVRLKTEKLFDFKSTGWYGCEFSDLELVKKQVPLCVINQYEISNKVEWNFEGAGIVLLNRSGKVIVLELNKHLTQACPQIITGDYGRNKYQLPYSQNFSGWFDIINSGPANKEVSFFKIYTNEAGDSLLHQNGIPVEFPAIVEHLKYYKYYYFAGDFATRNVTMRSSFFKGLAYLNQLFCSNASGSEKAFFWNFYNPLINNVLNSNLTLNN
jgi:hypothetical protein